MPGHQTGNPALAVTYRRSAQSTRKADMLSRTADHLFWMARYMERAENTARMLDINLKAQLLPQTPEQEERAQRSVLRISELEHAFAQRYDEPTQIGRAHV